MQQHLVKQNVFHVILTPPQSLISLALYPGLFHLQFLIICSSPKQTGILLYDLCVTQVMSQLLDTINGDI